MEGFKRFHLSLYDSHPTSVLGFLERLTKGTQTLSSELQVDKEEIFKVRALGHALDLLPTPFQKCALLAEDKNVTCYPCFCPKMKETIQKARRKCLFFKQMDLSRTRVISLRQKEKKKGMQVKGTAEVEIKKVH